MSGEEYLEGEPAEYRSEKLSLWLTSKEKEVRLFIDPSGPLHITPAHQQAYVNELRYIRALRVGVEFFEIQQLVSRRLDLQRDAAKYQRILYHLSVRARHGGDAGIGQVGHEVNSPLGCILMEQSAALGEILERHKGRNLITARHYAVYAETFHEVVAVLAAVGHLELMPQGPATAEVLASIRTEIERKVS